MYRTVNDFLTDWSLSTKGTIQVFESLKDEKLNQAIVEGHSTLGWIGWHIVTSTFFFADLVGIHVVSPGDEKAVPNKAIDILNAYLTIVEEVKGEIENMTDKDMITRIDNFGQITPRGKLLRDLIDHTTHHRGQMTVLLRQAGLPVPGVMGPTKEEQYY